MNHNTPRRGDLQQQMPPETSPPAGTIIGFDSLTVFAPTLCIGIPNAIREQAIQIGEILITVAEEAQAFAIFLARPFPIPHLPPRIIRVEVRAPQRLPTAMRAAFNIAARALSDSPGPGLTFGNGWQLRGY